MRSSISNREHSSTNLTGSSSNGNLLTTNGSSSSGALSSSSSSAASSSSSSSGGGVTIFQIIKTLLICCIFMLVGPSLIMVNQHILKNGFPYPMFLSGLGVLATGLAARVLIFLGYDKLQRTESVEGWLWFKRVLPVGFASAATLAFGNMVYLYLGVGFIQMLKSFTPVIMVLVAHVTRVELASTPVILSVIVISLGTATTCSFVPELNPIGLLIMFLSMACEAVRLTFTQFFLQNLKFGVIEGSYVLAPVSALWLFSASLFVEFPSMWETNAFAYLVSHPSIFLTSALMGVAVNFISYFMIQFTSSLTMKILITVRNMCMVVISVLFYHELVTFNQAVGYFIALLGFAGYNMSKMGMFQDWTYGDVYHHSWMPGLVKCLLPLPAKPEGEKGFLLLSSEI